MYYEINIALNGKHLFATHERSCTCKSKLNKLLPIFKEKFPKSEGYCISVSRIEIVGHIIDIEED